MNNKNLASLAAIAAVIILGLACNKKTTDPEPPLLMVSTQSLDFGSDLYGLQIIISNGGGSPLNWSIADQPSTWYSYYPSEGAIDSGSDTVNVFVDRVGSVGELGDTLTISSNGGTALVEILMQVPTAPTLSVYPTQLDLGADHSTGSLQIINAGPGQLDWNITEDLEWLELAPTGGSTTQEIDTIEVTITRPHLTNDDLNGIISVTSNGGSRSVEVAARDTVFTSEGIYTVLKLERTITRHSHMGYQRVDMIEASFDSIYAPCDPVFPMTADSVYCEDYVLLWDSDLNRFRYEQTMPRIFLDEGGLYNFVVDGNQQIPSFADSIMFPDLAPYITSPADSADFPRNEDLAVAWSDTGAGTIALAVISLSDSICGLPFDLTGFGGLFFETENDGDFDITVAALSTLRPGEYKICLFNDNAHDISAAGYDLRSFIIAGSRSYVTVFLQ